MALSVCLFRDTNWDQIRLKLVASWNKLQPFIPVKGQAGFDQTTNKLYVEETDVQTDRYMWTHTSGGFPAESTERADDNRSRSSQQKQILSYGTMCSTGINIS